MQKYCSHRRHPRGSCTEIAAKTFEHIEEWYMKFFDDVKSNYGDLENYFILNRDYFLMHQKT